MSDIVVTVPKGYFKNERYEKAWFGLGGHKPKRLKWKDRIYILYEGLIEEFYLFCGYSIEDDDNYEFDLGRHRRLVRPFPCKGFQGFRYAEKIGLNRKRGRACPARRKP